MRRALRKRVVKRLAGKCAVMRGESVKKCVLQNVLNFVIYGETKGERLNDWKEKIKAILSKNTDFTFSVLWKRFYFTVDT